MALPGGAVPHPNPEDPAAARPRVGGGARRRTPSDPALAALPETQRTAVWLVHACQWTYAETAEALGTSVSMVGNHVSRALKQLRDHLEVDSRA
jgi:DNA-directed RNA polymerase specialized sigma24 family protein